MLDRFISLFDKGGPVVVRFNFPQPDRGVIARDLWYVVFQLSMVCMRYA